MCFNLIKAVVTNLSISYSRKGETRDGKDLVCLLIIANGNLILGVIDDRRPGVPRYGRAAAVRPRLDSMLLRLREITLSEISLKSL